MKYEAERREIVKACQDMNRRGVNQGTSGNISVRVKEGFLLTPSGMAYDEMKPGDIVLMRADASHTGKRKPSSEWRFHHALMTSRREVGAVVHTHSMFATTLSCLGLEIPAVHYMIAAAGGENIRCAPYATYGTQETADNAVKALQDRNACLLANLGMIVVGPNLKKAMWLAVEVETLAVQYWRALQVGKPNTMGGRTLLRLDRPKSAPREGLRSHHRIGRSLPLRRCRHAAHQTSGAASMSFESDSKCRGSSWLASACVETSA